jgi:hypothetical protein
MHDDLVAQLGRRVQRLERSTGVGGPCPAWGGLGRDEVQVVFEPEAPPEPTGCLRCGRVGTVYQTVFVREMHTREEAPPCASAGE